MNVADHLVERPRMSTWPLHSSESRAWTMHADNRDRGGRRPPRDDRMIREITVSIPPRIRDLDPSFDRSTRERLEEASVAATRLDQAGGVNLGAMSGFLLRSESVASSKIEQLYADSDELAIAFGGGEASPVAREIVAASRAVEFLIETPSPLALEAIHHAHLLLLGDDPIEGRHAGAGREVQNWIGGSDFSPRGAVYVPPPPDLVSGLLGDLIDFMNRTDFGAVAQAGIAHAQFESIHPYTDGNGRIGRALLNTVLRHRGVTTRVAVPVASVLLADVESYFSGLDRYRKGEFDQWTTFVADAVLVASEEAMVSVSRLGELPGKWEEELKARAGSAARLLLDAALDFPVLTSSVVVDRLGVSRRAALNALERLADAGVLTEVGGRKERVWIADDVVDELDDLQDRIGHRTPPTNGRA